MKTIKPGALSLLTRVIEHRGRCLFVVSPMLFVSLGETRLLRSEAAMWKFAAAHLGPGAALDHGQPKALPEFLVHGPAFAPGARPVPSLAVRARVGTREKILYVFGDRRWEEDRATAPVPFSEMPLDWTRSYGGPGFAANPLGRGIVPDAQGQRPLPNIEDPADRLARPGQAIGAAGYGPRDVTHPDRAALAGTYDDQWLRNDFPGLAQDFDWRHCNVAPPDQWLEGALDPETEWEFENLHPDQPVLRGRLPGLVPRCFVQHRTARGERFAELAPRLDTVLFFPRQECAILVHRAVLEVAEDDAKDVELLLGAVEWAGERRNPAHYVAALQRRQDPETGHFSLLDEDDLLPSGPGERYQVERVADVPVQASSLLADNLEKRRLAEIITARATVAAHGLDPDEHGPRLPEPRAAAARSVSELPRIIAESRLQVAKMKEAKAALTTRMDAGRRAAAAQAGIDFATLEAEMKGGSKGPPKHSAKAQVAALTALRAGMTDPAHRAEMDQYLNDADFRKRLLAGEKATRESYRLNADHQEPTDPMPAGRAKKTRDGALRHHRKGRTFAGLDLTGADLSGLDLSGADFSGAYLEGANLAGAQLRSCKFNRAILARACLSGADCSDARFDEANLGKADCRGARLDRASLAGALLRGVDLRGASLAGADLRKADLSESPQFESTDASQVLAGDLSLLDTSLKGLVLRGADLERAVFVRCDLEGVDFSGASMSRVTMVAPKAAGACFRGITMSGGVFVGGSDLRGADFSDARLSTVSFRPSDLAAARFDRAVLQQVDLSDCQLRGASFAMAWVTDSHLVRSDLAEADCRSASFMHSTLQKASLEGVDFDRANLYGADMARVLIDERTKFTGALTHKLRTFPRRKPPPAAAP